jgi:hypothetical protein
MTERNSRTRHRGAWLTPLLLALALPACDDEILTDVDIPKDAAADRGTDAPKEGATGDAAPETSADGAVEAKAEASADATADAPEAEAAPDEASADSGQAE